MTKALNIPAINNHKGALTQHLGIDYDCKSIDERFTNGDVHHYVVNGKTYFVAAQRHQLAGDTLQSFNSALWSIFPIDCERPYVRFIDEKVVKHLKTIALDGLSLLAINQKEQRVLFKNSDDKLVVWGYTAHVPDDVTTYYFLGSSADMINGMKQMFSHSYQFKDGEKTVYCKED
jgi:hypothetical protein